MTTAAKKVHWTKTPKGKKRWAQVQLKGSKSAARKRDEGEIPNGSTTAQDVIISYALGHITAWLEVYAKSHGIPRPLVANRVGKALQDSARREVLGAAH